MSVWGSGGRVEENSGSLGMWLVRDNGGALCDPDHVTVDASSDMVWFRRMRAVVAVLVMVPEKSLAAGELGFS